MTIQNNNIAYVLVDPKGQMLSVAFPSKNAATDVIHKGGSITQQVAAELGISPGMMARLTQASVMLVPCSPEKAQAWTVSVPAASGRGGVGSGIFTWARCSKQAAINNYARTSGLNPLEAQRAMARAGVTLVPVRFVPMPEPTPVVREQKKEFSFTPQRETASTPSPLAQAAFPTNANYVGAGCH